LNWDLPELGNILSNWAIAQLDVGHFFAPGVFRGFIVRDAAQERGSSKDEVLLLMVRSASSRVSNHEALHPRSGSAELENTLEISNGYGGRSRAAIHASAR
jgi:hypothetical protein